MLCFRLQGPTSSNVWSTTSTNAWAWATRANDSRPSQTRHQHVLAPRHSQTGQHHAGDCCLSQARGQDHRTRWRDCSHDQTISALLSACAQGDSAGRYANCGGRGKCAAGVQNAMHAAWYLHPSACTCTLPAARIWSLLTPVFEHCCPGMFLCALCSCCCCACLTN